jgi:hypothetical protein
MESPMPAADGKNYLTDVATATWDRCKEAMNEAETRAEHMDPVKSQVRNRARAGRNGPRLDT